MSCFRESRPRVIAVTFVKRPSAPSKHGARAPTETRQGPSVASITSKGLRTHGFGRPPQPRRILCVADPPAGSRLPKQILSTLARRAYRRPVTDADCSRCCHFNAGRADGDSRGDRTGARTSW